MRYMLLVYGCRRYPEGSDELERKSAAVHAFIEMCEERGVLEAYDPLEPGDTATTVRVRDGEALVTDGPFAETREQLGGYFIFDCGWDEVRELAAKCPMAVEGAMEIRPIRELRPAASGSPALTASAGAQ